MKVSAEVLSNLAYDRLCSLVDGELSRTHLDDERVIDEAMLCLEIKRATSRGKKRLSIDVSYPKKD